MSEADSEYRDNDLCRSKSRSLFRKLSLTLLVVLAGCSSLPDNSNRRYSTSLSINTTEENVAPISSLIPPNNSESGFVLLNNGLDAFVARAMLAESAVATIDAQYYLLHDDVVGRLFVALLAEAAERGVRIRLLVDDFDLGNKDLGLSALDAHPNIEIRAFNPFSRSSIRAWQFISRFGSVTRRMHNKSFTVDNQITIIGGRNIGNEYFEANPAVEFGDLDVLASGPVVSAVSDSFDLYWNSELAYPISSLARRLPSESETEEILSRLLEYQDTYSNSEYAVALRNSDLANSLANEDLVVFRGNATLLADAPEKLTGARQEEDSSIAQDVSSLFAEAEEELLIFSPYFIAGPEGVAGFAELEQKGVDVKVLTNSLASNNHAAVHAYYAKYRKPLLRAGVDLYEAFEKTADEESDFGPMGAYKANTLHVKAFVIDRKRVFVGSLNFDQRSFVENTEMGVVFDSANMAEEFGTWFDENIETLAYRPQLIRDSKGREQLVWYGENERVVANREPATSLWQRLLMRLYRVVPLESQL